MERRDSIFGQFGETARRRDAQHGDGVCCAFAAQLVYFFKIRSSFSETRRLTATEFRMVIGSCCSFDPPTSDSSYSSPHHLKFCVQKLPKIWHFFNPVSHFA